MLPAIKFLNLSTDQITPEIEEEFFSSIMVRNKTYKTTYRMRFSEINGTLLSLLKAGDITARNILDIGISSGISTLELYEDLCSDGYASYIVGTDILIDAYIIPVFPGCCALVDDSSFPLRFDVFRWSMKPWVTTKDYRNGFVLVRKCINLIFNHQVKKISFCPTRASVKSVKLITPRIFKYRDIRICNDNITLFNSEYFQKYDFIRAANVLNRGYFSEATLKTTIGNIKRYLKGEGSSLLVIRTHEDHVNHGTLYRVGRKQSLEIVKRFGSGSEIDDIVMQSLE